MVVQHTSGSVQPMEWSRIPKIEHDDSETYRSSSPAYRQFFIDFEGGKWVYDRKPFDTSEAAQVSAQADFEKIIFSIFTPTVKPLEWAEDWGGSNDDIPGWRASTPWGSVSVSLAGHSGSEGQRYDRHVDAPADLVHRLQNDAEAHYQSKVLAAIGLAPEERT